MGDATDQLSRPEQKGKVHGSCLGSFSMSLSYQPYFHSSLCWWGLIRNQVPCCPTFFGRGGNRVLTGFHGKPTEVRSKGGKTALVEAAEKNNLEVAQVLLTLSSRGGVAKGSVDGTKMEPAGCVNAFGARVPLARCRVARCLFDPSAKCEVFYNSSAVATLACFDAPNMECALRSFLSLAPKRGKLALMPVLQTAME